MVLSQACFRLILWKEKTESLAGMGIGNTRDKNKKAEQVR